MPNPSLQLWCFTFRPRKYNSVNRQTVINFFEKWNVKNVARPGYIKKYWFVEEDSENDHQPSDTPNHMHAFLYTNPIQRDSFVKAIKRAIFDDRLTPTEWNVWKGFGKKRGLLAAYNFGFMDSYMIKQHPIQGADPLTAEEKVELAKLFPLPGTLQKPFEDPWFAKLDRDFRDFKPEGYITYTECQAFVSAHMFIWRDINILKDKSSFIKKCQMLTHYINKDVMVENDDESDYAYNFIQAIEKSRSKKRKRED